MTVAVITDGAAALPEVLRKETEIEVVPMWVVIDGRPYRDDEVALSEVLAAEPSRVTTAGPSPGEFAEAIRVGAGPDGALVATVASAVSSTYEAALVAARAVDTPIRVVDTGTAAGAQALVVLAAARAAASGGDLDRVEAVARTVAARTRLIAYLPSLDRLAASGRVPGAVAWAGRHLGLCPIFEFRAGTARPLMVTRDPEHARRRMLALWRKSRPEGANAHGAALHVASLHAESAPAAEELLEGIEAEADPASAFVGGFGPVMAAHTGAGLVGLAWWWEVQPFGLSRS